MKRPKVAGQGLKEGQEPAGDEGEKLSQREREASADFDPSQVRTPEKGAANGNGAAAAGAVPSTSDGTAKAGSNNPWGDPFTDEAITRIEELDEEAASIMGEAMSRVKGLRADQREIYTEAKERGLKPKVLRTHIKQRKLERRAEKLRQALQPPDQDSLDL